MFLLNYSIRILYTWSEWAHYGWPLIAIYSPVSYLNHKMFRNLWNLTLGTKRSAGLIDNSFYVFLVIHRKRRTLIFKTNFSHFMTKFFNKYLFSKKRKHKAGFFSYITRNMEANKMNKLTKWKSNKMKWNQNN